MFHECERSASSACVGKLYKKSAGKSFCVLHYPGDDKRDDFAHALSEKLKKKDFNFRGAFFVGEGGFPNAIFGDGASFYGAVFKDEANFFAATFEGYADFRRVQFRKGVDIRRATFHGEADFRNTTFSGRADFSFSIFESAASFFNSDFEDVNFISTTFKLGTEFRLTSFKGEANFSSATFHDYVTFRGENKKPAFGPQASLLLQFARLIKPGGASFHTVTLRPHWFVNVDARTFEFINVNWNWYGRKIRWKLKRQLREKAIPSYVLLAVACRQLAVNAEENNIYWRASSFRYLAMNVARLDTGHGLAVWTMDWWYWLASGFGERISRALTVFLIIWLSFAFLFSLPRPVRCPETSSGTYCLRWETTDKTRDYFDSFSNSAVYTIEAMTLQKPEPKPVSPLAHLATLLCTLLGPVQGALLLLAIRRKFMR